MALFDFATVQVYEAKDYIEVVFPYDEDFVSFLKDMKGRWNPTRKCWTVKSEFAKKPVDELIADIENKLYDIGPNQWRERVQKLRAVGCIINDYGIVAGAGGVKLTLPAGHPTHYALKGIKGILQNRLSWSIPAKMANNPEVMKAIQRMLREDKNKYYDWMEPSEGRGVFGETTLTREDEQLYGIVKGNMIAVSRSFMQMADPGMADTPTLEFAFTVDRIKRHADEKMELRLAYPDLDDAYEFLATRKNNPHRSKALEATCLVKDTWKQKRL